MFRESLCGPFCLVVVLPAGPVAGGRCVLSDLASADFASHFAAEAGGFSSLVRRVSHPVVCRKVEAWAAHRDVVAGLFANLDFNYSVVADQQVRLGGAKEHGFVSGWRCVRSHVPDVGTVGYR